MDAFRIWEDGAAGQTLVRAMMLTLYALILIAAAITDAKTKTIPDRYPLLILVLGIFAVWACPEVSLLERLAGMVIVSLPMFLLALLINGAFGGGDIKLMASGGLLLGAKAVVFAMLCGMFICGVFCVILLAKKKIGRKEQIAFGPFLAVGLAAAPFIGERVVDWYLRFL